MKSRAVSASIRTLAGQAQQVFPDHIVHEHLKDAANALDLGLHEGTQRLLNAAIGSLTPQNLHRSGIADDDHHVVAKQIMHAAHRHLLLVRDAMAGDQEPPIGRGDGTAQGPASPDPSGNYRFAGRAGGIELAGLAREMRLRLCRPRRTCRC